MPSTSTSPVSRGPVVPPDTPINLKILQAELEELKKANKTLNQQQQAKQVCRYFILNLNQRLICKFSLGRSHFSKESANQKAK